MMVTFAAIFDWDGVIIDSSRIHGESWEILAEREKRQLPDDYFVRSFGMRNDTIIPKILRWADDENEIQRLSDLKEGIYRELIAERGLSPLPGVKTFLSQLLASNTPCALGSSTPRLNIATALKLIGLGEFFRAIVGAEDVTRGKPDPQVFLSAAQKLAVPPERCVVFEDAVVGVEAALAGGMKVIAVTTTSPASALRKANRVVNRLDELTLKDLEALLVE
jgi:beta-phosphoglucomutase family hydrolase